MAGTAAPTAAVGDSNRRRHRRTATDVGAVQLKRLGANVVVAATDVRDVGIGGCFLLLSPPPALHEDVVITLLQSTLVLRGLVGRVQRGGRERGAPVRAGVAVAFVGVDESTLEALASLLDG